MLQVIKIVGMTDDEAITNLNAYIIENEIQLENLVKPEQLTEVRYEYGKDAMNNPFERRSIIFLLDKTV